MKPSIAEIARALDYTFAESEYRAIGGVAIDSRQVKQGDLFVAIVGERTDGHQYIEQAWQQGAAAVVVSKREYIKSEMNYILVEDGVIFVQKLAQYLRQSSKLPVVAVTGSTGKTSTKDLLTTILAQAGNIVATKGNHNNELGLPLTMCGIEADTVAVIVEMGMRGLGQIDFLCQLATPDYGIITNIGRVHSELLGSQENIAQAKCELLAYIPTEGAVALNWQDREFLEPWLATCKGKKIWYSLEAGYGDLWAENILEGADSVAYDLCWAGERKRITLNIPGRHQVANSLAAIAIARTLGVEWDEIISALQNLQMTGMRLDIKQSDAQITWINDTYNANPASVKAALQVLQKQSGKRKIAVLGDMYELGKYEQLGHQEVGEEAVHLGIDYLLAVGSLGKLIAEQAEKIVGTTKVAWVENNSQAIAYLRQLLQPEDVVLVKGSRGMAMEEIVEKFMG